MTSGPVGEGKPPVTDGNGSVRHMPTFIVIGAMKAGTTSLFHYLVEHPEVHMSPLKEVDFFVEESNWSRGFEWYGRQFDGATPRTVAIGEASTIYTKYPAYRGVPERIRRHLPDVRLIYVVRDPIARLRSHYQHRTLVGNERRPLAEAIDADPTYIDTSRYGMQLDQYLEHFPREQIRIITSEALRSSRAETVRDVYRFIGVDETFAAPSLEQEFYRTEERAQYPSIAWKVRKLAKRYVPHSKRAKELVDSILPKVLGRRTTAAASGTATETPAVTIPDDLTERLRLIFAEDVALLRRSMPPGFDGWGIA
jgi:Sulfotransferase domain